MISSWTTFLRHFISQKHRPWNALLLKGKCRPSHFKEIRSCMYLYTTSMDWVRHWHWSGDSYEVKTKYQNEEERWFRWLWKWHGRWCQTGWFDKLLIYWDFHMQPSPGFIENGGRGGSGEWQFSGRKCFVDWRGQRQTARVVWAYRNVAATQITTNMQMSIAEHSTKNMEADGPQQKTTTPGAAPVISEQEIEWHGFTKNWDKTLPGRDESRFVVQHSDGRVRIWHKQNESTDPSCFYIDDSGWWCNCIADVFFLW